MIKNIDSAITDMIYLSACVIHGVRPDVSHLSACDFEALYRLCRFHSLTSLVYTAMENAFDGELPQNDIFTQWREERDKSIRNNLIMDAERRQLFLWCDRQKIWYLPLKGILLKEVYPKPELRQMADNDILIDSAHREQVHDWFVTKGYEVKSYKTGVQDVYQKKPILHFEMHTALFSKARNPGWASYYENVFDKLVSDEANSCAQSFSHEDFFIYTMAHAYKHYANSGNGLRSLIDIYLYQEKYSGLLNETYMDKEFEKLGILEFTHKTRAVAKKLFTHTETPDMNNFTENERAMLHYYLSSGTYGTKKHRIKNHLIKSCHDKQNISYITKIKYLYRRLFPGREYMLKWCSIFAPFYLKHKSVFWLSPLCRLFRSKTFTNAAVRNELSAVLTARKASAKDPLYRRKNK